MSTKKFYRPELDALRFCACAAVFLFHFGCSWISPEHDRHGALLSQLRTAFIRHWATGVDLFFCLSAFLITILLLKECDAKGTFDLKNFYARRALRILPLYFLIVIVCCYLYPQMVIHKEAKLLYSSVILANAWVMLGRAAPGTIDHLWTIGIEEQFYFAHALIMKFKPAWLSVRNVAMLVIGLSAISKAFLAVHHWNIRPNTLARLDPIAVGILLADYIHRCRWAPSDMTRVLLFIAGPVLIFCDQYLLGDKNGGLLSMAFYPVVAVACGSMIAAAYGQKSLRIPDPVIHLGKISYGLYIFHMPIMYWFNHHIGYFGRPHSVLGKGAHSAVILCGSAAMTLVCALASYRWLEMPILRWKDKRFGSAVPLPIPVPADPAPTEAIPVLALEGSGVRANA